MIRAAASAPPLHYLTSPHVPPSASQHHETRTDRQGSDNKLCTPTSSGSSSVHRQICRRHRPRSQCLNWQVSAVSDCSQYVASATRNLNHHPRSPLTELRAHHCHSPRSRYQVSSPCHPPHRLTEHTSHSSRTPSSLPAHSPPSRSPASSPRTLSRLPEHVTHT